VVKMAPKIKTFEMQSSLPVLPVPDLKETLKVYLESVEPLLTQEEFAETKKKVEDFGRAGGVGEKLHAMLLERASKIKPRDGPEIVTPANHPDGSAYPNAHWLEEWWESKAYLEDRTSLAVNINCFQTHLRSRPCSQPLLRGAWFLKGCLDAQRQLVEQLVEPEKAGKGAVLCNSQYMRVYSTTRIPLKNCDHLMTYTESRHICVERRGHWYILDNVHEYSVADFYEVLQAIKDDADVQARGPGIAAFTGTDRDSWADARDKLRKLSKANAEMLEIMESAIFHICLSEATPDTPSEAQRQGQCGNGEQIWFDKSGSHLICDNGVMISNLEHTSADAVVPARFWTYVDEFIHANCPEVGYSVKLGDKYTPGLAKMEVTRVPFGTKSSSLAKPRRLDFELDADLHNALHKAKADLAKIIDDNTLVALEFLEFGAKTISSTCKPVTTDSFVQMSLALAYYRDQGEVPVPYETASTRGFFHGRTETIRPQSLAMKEFLQAFDNSSVPRAQVADLIRAAADYHRNYMRRCMAGKGIDRHLLGLRVLAAMNGIETPAIFADKAYQVSTCFTLSTSQMPWAMEDWPGFGAYDPKAYATCYRFTSSDSIVATVVSRKRSGGTKDAVRFTEMIKQAFRDIHEVLSTNPMAKL